jgi:hypothetical protein
MGLAGMGFLFDLNQNRDARWYGGLSVYGAMNGQRGGFFTGGVSSGLSVPLGAGIAVDAGLFVGGGGGGAAPQGGGLMLRPHVGLDYQLANWCWGLQWSRVRFPNGAIDSEQWSLTLARPLHIQLASGWLINQASTTSLDTSPFASSVDRRLSMNQWNYYPVVDGRATGMRLLGFSIDFQQGRHHYLSLQTAGAVAGNVDGYAEVLWAYGLTADWTEHISWRAALALGAGGGGAVATGGGLLGRATAAAEYRFSETLETALTLGYVSAPQGDFRARVVGVQLAYHYAVPSETGHIDWTVYRPQHWRVRGTWQSYQPYGDSRRKGETVADTRRVDLVGSKFDWMLSDHVYATGQALGAYDGGAGGYAVGEFGLGWRYPLMASWYANSELLLGVGGGGGLDVGGGMLLQGMVGLEWALNDYLGVIISAGELVAMEGQLQTHVVDVALAYRFSTPIKN